MLWLVNSVCTLLQSSCYRHSHACLLSEKCPYRADTVIRGKKIHIWILKGYWGFSGIYSSCTVIFWHPARQTAHCRPLHASYSSIDATQTEHPFRMHVCWCIDEANTVCCVNTSDSSELTWELHIGQYQLLKLLFNTDISRAAMIQSINIHMYHHLAKTEMLRKICHLLHCLPWKHVHTLPLPALWTMVWHKDIGYSC